MKKKNKTTLKWKFDVNTFRLLGRELVADRITAMVELIKNAYDANSTEVTISFLDSDKPLIGKIIIEDNGIGMTLNDIEKKWMVIGTNNKRKKTYSPKPFNRKYIGEKGIGRFAVDKLGSHLKMITKTKGNEEELELEINWELYEEISQKSLEKNENTTLIKKNETDLISNQEGQQIPLFTDIENEYKTKKTQRESQGTSLIISKLNEPWSLKDIKKLEKELGSLFSPFHLPKPPFHIWIKSNIHKGFLEKKLIQQKSKIDFSTIEIQLDFNLEKKEQEQILFNEKTGEFDKVSVPIKSFGPIKVNISYFDAVGKRKFNSKYGKGKEGDRINGIKIYRDNMLTTPFAENNMDAYLQKDVLGLDKRRWRNTFDTIGSREVIGVIDITKEDNPKIIDSTNRQDFIDNKQYKDLKAFIIFQMEQIEAYKVFQRKKNKKEVETNLKALNKEFEKTATEFNKRTAFLRKNNPLLAEYIDEIEGQVSKIKKNLKTGVKVLTKENIENKRKETLYLSLMSLQEYAAHLSHAVRTSLGKIKRQAEFFYDEYPNIRYETYFKEYAKNIFNEIQTLEKVVNFMLSYAKSTTDIEEFNVKTVIEEVFNQYKPLFGFENIHTTIELKDDFLLTGNKKFVEDILNNLIANSVKALKGIDYKIIKCTGEIVNKEFNLIFSDNGCGIDEEDKNKIFSIYYTKTAQEGGAGLGLFIVKTRLEALHGKITLEESELPPGATFKISFPFRK